MTDTQRFGIFILRKIRTTSALHHQNCQTTKGIHLLCVCACAVIDVRASSSFYSEKINIKMNSVGNGTYESIPGSENGGRVSTNNNKWFIGSAVLMAVVGAVYGATTYIHQHKTSSLSSSEDVLKLVAGTTKTDANGKLKLFDAMSMSFCVRRRVSFPPHWQFEAHLSSFDFVYCCFPSDRPIRVGRLRRPSDFCLLFTRCGRILW